jgi:dCMP deaminase
MGRISREVMFMQMARVASMRSTCFRLNVGAILTLDNSPVSVGWNGAEAGAPHCAGNDCPGIVPGNCGTLHAEVNALEKAERMLFKAEVHLYCTDSPCPECVSKIIGSKIHVTKFFYEKLYRVNDHLQSLADHRDPNWPHRGDIRRRTEIYMVTPAGYIVEHFTRQVLELP